MHPVAHANRPYEEQIPKIRSGSQGVLR